MSGNSIYSYYRQISDRYYVALTYSTETKREVKYLWEPLARRIRAAGYEEFDLFITGTMRNYEIHEALTGALLLRQREMASRPMRRAGMKMLEDFLPAEIRRKGGPGFINGAIINFLVDYGHRISPRYEPRDKPPQNNNQLKPKEK